MLTTSPVRLSLTKEECDDAGSFDANDEVVELKLGSSRIIADVTPTRLHMHSHFTDAIQVTECSKDIFRKEMLESHNKSRGFLVSACSVISSNQ